jgi:type II secretory pathway pseudopilin PulG
MMRLLELIVALIIVAVLGLILGIALPASGHVERTVVVSKDIRHVYDMLDNFRRFPEYAVLRAYDPQMKYQQGDQWYGPGSSISWTSGNSKVGDGKLTIVSAEPNFDQVELQGRATIVWSLNNNWHGKNKLFTIKMERTGRTQKLVKINWAYDVDYGWNLIDRYSNLYIHGDPDSLIQYSLNNLQNVLATVPNIDYRNLVPQIVDTPPQAVLYVSTSAPRTLNDVDAATDAALTQIAAAMKKLGVHAIGPRITFDTNYGDENYDFDVAVPIDATSLTIGGQSYELTAPQTPKEIATAPTPAESASVANAASVAAAGSAAPASPSSAANAKPTGPQPGSRDRFGHLIVDANVRGMLAFGGRALQGEWNGSPAGVPPTRLMLEAYARTHGYRFDEVTYRPYDVQAVAYGDKDAQGNEIAYDEQTFKVYLPLITAPAQTPEQAAGMQPPKPDLGEPASSGTAPAPASSASVVAPTVESSSAQP